MDRDNNYNVENHPKGVKANNLHGLLLLVPVLIVAALFMLTPIFRIAYRSLTLFNNVDTPVYIGLDNYRRLIFEDDIATISIRNTFILTFLSVVSAFGLSFMLAWASSRLHRNLKTLLCIMLCWISLTYIMPHGVSVLFSGDSYGYVNSYLLRTDKIFDLLRTDRIFVEPVHFSSDPRFISALSILIPVLIGLGPLYVLFTLAFKNRKRLRFYAHLAASLQIIISIVSHISVMQVVGFPSTNYAAHTLMAHATDYMLVRFEIGYGSAILILLGMLVALIVLLINALIWLSFELLKIICKNRVTEYKTQQKPTTRIILSVMIFSAFIMFLPLLISPFLITFLESFKPLDELWLFPRRIAPIRPTLQNYANLFKIFPLAVHAVNSLLAYALAIFALLITAGLTGISLACYPFRGRRILLYGLTFSFLLSPMLLLWSDSPNYNTAISTALPALFSSVFFGLSVYLFTKLMERLVQKGDNVHELVTPGRLIRMFPAMLSIASLGALTVWFNVHYFPSDKSQYTFIQAAMEIAQSGIARVGEASAMLVLSMIVPFLVVLVAVPIVLRAFDQVSE